MKKIKWLLLMLLIPAVAYGLLLQSRTFTWEHGGQNVSGFRLYKGLTPDPTKMTRVQETTDPTARSMIYSVDLDSTDCFGVSAYNQWGESEITVVRADGSNICVLGKPAAPINVDVGSGTPAP